MSPGYTHVGVVGAGPVALATADRLRKAKFKVSLIKSVVPSGTRCTFPAAAAFWTPFCHGGMSPARQKDLSELTLKFYHDILATGTADQVAQLAGVIDRRIEMHFLKGTKTHTPDWSRFPELSFKAKGKGEYSRFEFERYPGLKTITGRDNAQARVEFCYKTPTIQVDYFMKWYSRHLQHQADVKLLEVPFPFIGPDSIGYDSEHLIQWRHLIADESIDCLVVCTGASTVYNRICSPNYPRPDSFQPMKGVVAHIKIPPTRTCSAVLFEGGFFDTHAPLYMVPLVDRYVLGGTIHAVSQTDDDSFWQISDAEKLGIIERAQCFLPEKQKAILRNSGLFDNMENENLEWRAGVRPMLTRGPVVEHSEILTEFISTAGEPHPINVFLHYGHGGSGFTMCHDTAELVVLQLSQHPQRKPSAHL